MSTSPVRIREDDKRWIQRLQEEVADASGKRPSQQEVVHELVDFAVRNRETFLSEMAWKPLSEEEIERWTSKVHDLGDWTIDDIDDIVYGEGS